MAEMGPFADRIRLDAHDIETSVDGSQGSVSRRETDDGAVLNFLRRSRGYAPNPIHFEATFPQIIAYGAELKTTLAVSKANAVYLSQHIGDLKNDETFESHQACGAHMTKLLDIEPEAIAIDMHPQFRSSLHARTASDLPVVEVQHHHAHMASCLLDNGVGEPCLGVIMDGMGYGPDNTVWGGEILLGDFADYKRAAHLRPFVQIGGDKAVKNPIRIALALLQEAYGEEAGEVAGEILPQLSEQERHVFLRMAERRINSAVTTSAGRLFDAAACLLGLCHRNRFEGEAAMALQFAAEAGHTDEAVELPVDTRDGLKILDWRPLFERLLAGRRAGEPAADLALLFHRSLAAAMAALAAGYAQATVALGGGCFQNRLLLELSVRALQAQGKRVYWPQQVPANDGGLAFGQAVIGLHKVANHGGTGKTDFSR
jgi:hydrogenase maturation protein HypF